MAGPVGNALRSYRGLLDARVWILTYGQVVQSLGRGILMPFSTLYFYNVQHFPLALVGLAWGVAFPVGSIVGLYWGAKADAVGRKPLLLLGFAGVALSTAAMAFVGTIEALFVAIVLQSVFMAAARPASQAMVADVTPPQRRTRAYGLLYMANNLGLSLGLVVGGILAVFLPYRVLFFADAGGTAIFGAVILLFVGETLQRRERAPGTRGSARARLARQLAELGVPLRNRAFLTMGLAGLLVSLGWSQFYITYSPYLKNVVGTPDAWIGALFSVNTVLVVLLQIPLASWAERRSRTGVFLVSNVLLLASLLVTWAAGLVSGVATAAAVMVLAVVVMTLGEIVAAPVGPALVAGLAGSSENAARYMAAYGLINSIGIGLGSTVGGAFFDAGRPVALYPSVALAVLVGLGVIRHLGRVLPDEVNRPEPEENLLNGGVEAVPRPGR